MQTFFAALLTFLRGRYISSLAIPVTLKFSFPVPRSIALHRISSSIFSVSFSLIFSLDEYFCTSSWENEKKNWESAPAVWHGRCMTSTQRKYLPSSLYQLLFFRLYMVVSIAEFCPLLSSLSVLLSNTSFVPFFKKKKHSWKGKERKRNNPLI